MNQGKKGNLDLHKTYDIYVVVSKNGDTFLRFEMYKICHWNRIRQRIVRIPATQPYKNYIPYPIFWKR